jgi:hypothetical protein
MKKILFILPFLFIPLLFGDQFNQSITISYINSTKREIVKDLKLNKYDFEISPRMWVIVDSNNKWILSDDYYSYLFDFDDNERLSVTFDLKTSRCISYIWKYTSYDEYYDYISCFNDYLCRIDDELIWVDKGNEYDTYFKIQQRGDKGFSLYVYKK